MLATPHKVESPSGVIAGVFQNRQDWEANARLITAAPDLLEAAKDIYAAYGTYAGMDAQWRAQLETLRAAIAKAEG
jgi:hypothetical protein